VNFNAYDEDRYCTPLSYAISEKSFRFAEEVIAHPSFVFTEDTVWAVIVIAQEIPWSYRSDLAYRRTLLKKLLNTRTDKNISLDCRAWDTGSEGYKTALDYAMEYNWEEGVLLLLKYGANPAFLWTPTLYFNNAKRTPIYKALQKNWIDIVEKMLESKALTCNAFACADLIVLAMQRRESFLFIQSLLNIRLFEGTFLFPVAAQYLLSHALKENNQLAMMLFLMHGANIELLNPALRERFKFLTDKNNHLSPTAHKFYDNAGVQQGLSEHGMLLDDSLKETHEKIISKNSALSLKPHRKKDYPDGDPHYFSLFHLYGYSVALAKLGRGSFGVAKKHIAATGECFAVKTIKIPSPDPSKRRKCFDYEVIVNKLLGRYKAHGIIDKGDHQKAYLAMEYYPGKSLFDVLIRIDDVARLFTLQEMFSLMLSMLDEVKALHDVGIVHNDIKLENFLINENLEAKLIDFGLARENNTVYYGGSKEYIAPEVREGFAVRTARTDIYSLGIVFWHMLDRCDERYTLDTLIADMTHPDRFQRPSIEDTIQYIETAQKRCSVKRARMDSTR
jgi:hypothetical protein